MEGKASLVREYDDAVSGKSRLVSDAGGDDVKSELMEQISGLPIFIV